MHRFQPSRGRILLEVFCALAVVASMVGAWQQTHASALLTAAAAVGLLAMIRLFDLGRREPAVAEEPQRIGFGPEVQDQVPAASSVEELVTAVEPLPMPLPVNEAPESVEPAPRAGNGRRKGGSRKGGGRRAGAPKEAEVLELAPAEEVEVADLPVAAVEIAETASAEPAHVPHAPLFEPEPFVRMQRQAFGRRGRI
jgi:hypothetical protein